MKKQNKNFFLSFINIFFRSEFVKNSMMLTAGTTFAQFLPILISPVLARLYAPEDYGLLALFLSLSSLISIIASARYEMAIILPVKEKDAVNIVALSGIIVLILTFILILSVLFFNRGISLLLKNPGISGWLYLLPVMVFFTGFYQILNFWTIRIKEFRHLTYSKITQTFAGSSVNLGLGFTKAGAAGLIAGSLIGQIFSTVILFLQSFKKLKENLKNITRADILKAAKKYSDFPKINSLHAFSDVLRDIFVIFLISSIFNDKILGFYAFTLRILKFPSTLIGSSIAQVFFQKASEEKNIGKNLDVLTKKMIIWLSFISLPFFIILFFFAPEIFGFVFGMKWIEAGVYAGILSPWLYLNFISSPISQIPLISGKQKEFFIISLIYNLIMVMIIVSARIFSLDIKTALFLMSLLLSIMLILTIAWIYRITLKKNNNRDV